MLTLLKSLAFLVVRERHPLKQGLKHGQDGSNEGILIELEKGIH